MSPTIIMKLNEDPITKKFLHEYSYWYNYLNRSDAYFKPFITDIKEKYKLTRTDKLNKFISDINMIKSILEVLK